MFLPPGFLPKKTGGDERARTADLLVANEALSQLSYIPTGRFDLTGSPGPVKCTHRRKPRAGLPIEGM